MPTVRSLELTPQRAHLVGESLNVLTSSGDGVLLDISNPRQHP